MRVVRDVDILSDARTQRLVTRLSLATLAACALVGAALAVGGAWRVAGIAPTLVALGAYLACLPLHELVHAALFLLLGPCGTRVRFGYASGMLYATCPGTVLSRGRFAAVLLAPCVVISAACAVVGAALDQPLLAWAVFALHGAGCAGDLYFVWLILRTPEATACEDTDRGMRLLAA